MPRRWQYDELVQPIPETVLPSQDGSYSIGPHDFRRKLALPAAILAGYFFFDPSPPVFAQSSQPESTCVVLQVRSTVQYQSLFYVPQVEPVAAVTGPDQPTNPNPIYRLPTVQTWYTIDPQTLGQPAAPGPEHWQPVLPEVLRRQGGAHRVTSWWGQLDQPAVLDTSTEWMQPVSQPYPARARSAPQYWVVMDPTAPSVPPPGVANNDIVYAQSLHLGHAYAGRSIVRR